MTHDLSYEKALNDAINTLIDYYKGKSDKLHEKCASLEAELEQARDSLPTNEKCSTLQAKCASLEAELGQARAELKQARAECAELRIYRACYQQALGLLKGDNQNMDKLLVRELKNLFGVDLQVTQ